MTTSATTVVFDDVELNRGDFSGVKKKRTPRVVKSFADPGTPESNEPTVLKPGGKCRTEVQRQQTLNYAQRTVWANLQRIIEAAIKQSLLQNYTAAKFLCEFAGVFAASEQDREAAGESANAAPDADPMQTFLTEVAETIGQ